MLHIHQKSAPYALVAFNFKGSPTISYLHEITSNYMRWKSYSSKNLDYTMICERRIYLPTLDQPLTPNFFSLWRWETMEGEKNNECISR